MQSISRSLLMLVGTAILSSNVMAAEPAVCKNVRLGVVNWTDVMATSAMTQVLLDGLGYQTKQTSASQQIIFAGIRDQRLDMFLGYWNPIMTQTITPFVDAGQVKVLDAPSLNDARATRAAATQARPGDPGFGQRGVPEEPGAGIPVVGPASRLGRHGAVAGQGARHGQARRDPDPAEQWSPATR